MYRNMYMKKAHDNVKKIRKKYQFDSTFISSNSSTLFAKLS